MLPLTGTYPRTLDEKNRLVFPKRVREQLEGEGAEKRELKSVYVCKGTDRCLWLLPLESMKQIQEKLDKVSEADPQGRVYERLFFPDVESVELDRSGRILIPERLIEFAGLKGEVVLIGVRNRLELWEAQRWQAYLAQNSPRFDAVAEGAFKT